MPIIKVVRGTNNERGVLVSWLMKLLIGFAIAGVVLFDGGSILVNYFTLDSAADDTAVAVSLAIETDQFGSNDEAVFQKTVEIVASGSTGAADAKVVHNGTFVDEQKLIHVKLKRVASTFLVKRIQVIAKWARAVAEGTALAN
jgi:hypothetical protein